MKGLEARYNVEKINDPAGKHDDCWYFVLDPKHDPHAINALVAYAESVQEEYPQLAQDLGKKLVGIVGELLVEAADDEDAEEDEKPEGV